ncbi:MAG: 50S ribosomal protein L30 [Bacteroidetes bacterium]|nr:50S ribosomal protein L30 [Bacteroidota bacterium]
MAKVKITLVKSVSKRTAKQRLTVEALGFKRTNTSIEKEVTPQIQGMINAVAHLVKVESI